MAGMESFQLLNMEEEEDVDFTQVSLQERSPTKNTRAGDPRRSSDGSLESLHFSFDHARQGSRLAQPKSWISRMKWWITIGVLGGLVFAFGFLACRVYDIFDGQKEAGLRRDNWKDRLDFIPDFARCPGGYADRPVVIVVSMDGLQADLIQQTTALRAVAKAGLHASHMRPVFPTATFPNHYSIVTGLHPESHGIIDNMFSNADFSDTFAIWNNSRFQSTWWKGRPIWQVAQEQGLRVSAHYWPGSDVLINGVRPTAWVNFSMTETVESRAQTVLDLLKLPKEERPHLVLTYYHQPDFTAHSKGINGVDYQASLASADQLASQLMERLAEHSLMDCVDLLFISDHGIANYNGIAYPAIALKENFGDAAKKINIEEGPGTQNRINPLPAGISVNKSLIALACHNDSSPYQLYAKENLPRRYHYINSDRIAPIILTANVSVTLHTAEYKNLSPVYALHGWDNIYSSMRASFIAYGPSFRRNITVFPFLNVELFGLLCELLGIEAGPNNGTQGSLTYMLRKPQSQPSNERAELKAANSYQEVGDADLSSVTPEPLCSSMCPTVPRELLASALTSSLSLKNDLLRYHFGALGEPTVIMSPKAILLTNMDFITGFCQQRNMPLWTAFQIRGTMPISNDSPSSVGASFASQVSCIYQDPRTVGSVAANCLNQSSFGQKSEEAAKSSYLFPSKMASNSINAILANMSSNMVTMYPTFRTGIWKRFWDLASSWASSHGPINAVIGPVFDSLSPFGIADDMDVRRRVPRQSSSSSAALPSHFFAILSRQMIVPACETQSCLHDMMTFVIPHQPKEERPCQKDRFFFLTHTATVRDVELLTGLRFFGGLSVNEAARLKTRLTDALWDDVPL